MITKRIIPCLDVKDGRVVKGVNFKSLGDVDSPVALAKRYSECGADELVFYDITASAEGRALFTDILCETAKSVFIPLTVGGGINTVNDFDRVLKCGADKVSVNSGAIRDPSLVYEAAKLYGSQCVVLSCDIMRQNGKFCVFSKGGRESTGLEAIEWISSCLTRSVPQSAYRSSHPAAQDALRILSTFSNRCRISTPDSPLRFFILKKSTSANSNAKCIKTESRSECEVLL